jgi:aspartokinase/homoserine dehydrogenase 1
VGVTDTLIECGRLASVCDEKYKEMLQAIEQRHLEAVKSLIPVAQQSSILSWVKKRCNELEDICNGVFLLGELSARTKTGVVSYGELISSYLISSRFKVAGTENTWKDSRELIVTIPTTLTQPSTSRLLIKILQIISPPGVLPYLYCLDLSRLTPPVQPPTLGRGGSDYTAAILAAGIHASALEIWTDVSGMMTADPRLVNNAKVIDQISYQEAMELSHFGAKVIYPPTIQPVMDKSIPVWIKNTFLPGDPGTVIQSESVSNSNTIRGISSISKIALLSLEGSGMVGIPGIFKAFV